MNMKNPWAFCIIFFSLLCAPAQAKDTLRILTWPGYVTTDDLSRVNQLLSKSGYDIEAKVISPYAEGAEQMFALIREKKADISFLTLFFIKLQDEKTSATIQPINTASPRLSNYKYLLPSLTTLPMGMRGDQHLYIPFAGGSYGFYANRKQVSAEDLPKSWGDLLDPRWKGKYSLNRSQVWYNIAIASMALGKAPYYLNTIAEGKDGRDRIRIEAKEGGPLAEKLSQLYRNAGSFWDVEPSFTPNLQIVSSWGVEVKQANKEGGDWQLISFKEGNLVWLDTINFVSGMKGKKLEAAEIVANYFIGKEVQTRVATELSLVSVSTQAKANPILEANPNFFKEDMFVPSYSVIADNVMTSLSDKTFKKLGLPSK